MPPVEPPGSLTSLVLDRIQSQSVHNPPQTLAWVFFVAGYFFFFLFVVLAAGVRIWACQGISLVGLNMVRDAVFVIAMLLAAAGLGLTHGGKWGLWAAYTIAATVAAGIGVSSIGLSLKVSGLSATVAVLGYGFCGVAMALILLKGLKQNENHG